jgi:hypothetical protein
MKTGTFKKLKLLFVIAIILLIIQSCVKDNFDLNKLEKTTWNPNLAIPLVYSSLSLQNILLKTNSNGLIIQNDSNFCTLVYNNTLLSIRADSLIQLPNQQYPSYSASLTSAEISTLGSANSVTVSYSQTVTFNSGTNNPKIDTIIFKAGSLDILLNSDFQYSGQIVITIPSATKNGIAFSETLPFTYSGTTPVTAAANDSLAGYLFDMTVGGTTTNEFVVNYTVTLSGTGTPPTTSDMISISGSLNNIQFDKIFGYLGQLSLFPALNKDTIAISIFKNYTGNGTFTLVNPSVKVTISNSYGVPINASLPLLEGFNPPFNSYPLTGVPNPIPILSPNYSQIGQTLTDSFTLTKTNSNMLSIINNYPKFFIFSASALTNPGGPTSNFVIDTSRCKIATEVDLPLYGTASNFTLIDTVQFSPGQFITSNIESALFRIYTLNGFPIDVNMQIYFTDSTYHALDSLVIPNQLILKSGVLNNAGIVVSSTPNTYTTTITKTRLTNLTKAKYLLIKDTESTTNGGKTNVKIYSTYQLNVQIGMQVQVQTKI